MSSFCRIALLLALVLPAMHVLSAEPASGEPAAPEPAQAQQAAPQGQPQLSVQARIRARREQRRAAAIREVYTHLYEAYTGGGYLRFTPGKTLQRVNEYNWNLGFTRYFDERLGVTVEGRGIYGTAYIEPQQGTPPAGDIGIDKPAIDQYAAMIGPTYRFYLQPKYSVSGRVMAGFARGNFSGDTGGSTSLAQGLGLYPDADTFAASASLSAEYNLTPNVGIRVAPEYFATGFGSTIQNSLGFTSSIVYRFGKQ
jgi:hypothetical protein